MSENKADAMSRLRSMANGDPTWDLSDNDCAAIQMALDEIERLRAALREAARHLALHGMLTHGTRERYAALTAAEQER